ncbi:MAG: hypothetical protein COY40_06025 [Alphaproteobacteria bacterium CG_4_10_14_0_8_um_filter_53_9]|nr:MAG: hypothetical protein COY40_06025 [Alphaproteobacteria bacterium CG_4_10_14_0_8_um_filter_53_9]
MYKNKKPNLRLTTKEWTYHLGTGEVPEILARHPKLYSGNPFKIEDIAGVNTNLTGKPEGSVYGHHCVYDTNFSVTLETDPHVPVSPCFVRDLAGRTIYLGGPLIKNPNEWEAHGGNRVDAEGNLIDPLINFITFPRYSADAAAMEGADMLETIFLTQFRNLDMSLRGRSVPSGAPEDADNVALSYDGANLYPYKWRPDTFYIDGYKLPQTTMLYAKTREEGANPLTAKTMGDELLAAWENRPEGQTYEAFIGGKDIDALYQKGCTLIPTFEARNGYHVVSETFELKDYWPGRNVPGLHGIVEERDDSSPTGTILEVISPGFITETHIEPALVVVSNGSRYLSPHAATNPLPFIPNMHLPHQRTLADWRATWLPTHPMHFEAPALWGFDLITGHFMQLNGPLWDPLHYYYSCTEILIQASKKPLSEDQNRYFIPVPEEMEGRFYPIIPMSGFDVLSVEALERKREQNRRPFSLVTRLRNGKETAGIGYHPLPIEFEYELEPFWFPTLHPLNREQGDCPEALGNLIVPIIRPTVGVDEYLQHVSAPDEIYWLKDKTRLSRPSENPLENFPQLMRFMGVDVPLETLLQMIPLPFLADPGEDILFQPTESYFAGEDSAEDLAEIDSDIFDDWWDARDEGHMWVKFRHLIYRDAVELYALGWWYGATPLLLEEMLKDWIDNEEAASRETEATDRLKAR